MIKDEFFDAVNAFDLTHDKASKLWQEVEKYYGDSSRYYHTLTHLEYLIVKLHPVKASFSNWYVVVFAIVYHDIVYMPSKSNNEEKSADLAIERLSSIAVPHELIMRCRDFILATKRHEPVDAEIDLFTDADLSILGCEDEVYLTYTKQIRKEYSMYPDLLYKPGRRKVLNHFLGMDHIYKSTFFRDRYEASARRNLVGELDRL